MKYISTGAVMAKGTEHVFEVCKGNHKFTLARELAAVWLSGRLAFSDAKSASEIRNLEHLCRMSLAVKAEDADAAKYRALTRCTLAPADCRYPYLGLSALEKTKLKWLREAGLRLTIAELIYLNEHGILPTPALLGSEHTQELVETIYTRETILDNILESQMESAASRDDVVNAVLRLLKKKRIILL